MPDNIEEGWADNIRNLWTPKKAVQEPPEAAPVAEPKAATPPPDVNKSREDAIDWWRHYVSDNVIGGKGREVSTKDITVVDAAVDGDKITGTFNILDGAENIHQFKFSIQTRVITLEVVVLTEAMKLTAETAKRAASAIMQHFMGVATKKIDGGVDAAAVRAILWGGGHLPPLKRQANGKYIMPGWKVNVLGKKSMKDISSNILASHGLSMAKPAAAPAPAAAAPTEAPPAAPVAPDAVKAAPAASVPAEPAPEAPAPAAPTAVEPLSVAAGAKYKNDRGTVYTVLSINPEKRFYHCEFVKGDSTVKINIDFDRFHKYLADGKLQLVSESIGRTSRQKRLV